jgi:hypothetical protein
MLKKYLKDFGLKGRETISLPVVPTSRTGPAHTIFKWWTLRLLEMVAKHAPFNLGP